MESLNFRYIISTQIRNRNEKNHKKSKKTIYVKLFCMIILKLPQQSTLTVGIGLPSCIWLRLHRCIIACKASTETEFDNIIPAKHPNS